MKGIKMKHCRIIRSKRLRVTFEPNWRDRPYPYWFNAKYSDGMRRICVPFLCIDLPHK